MCVSLCLVESPLLASKARCTVEAATLEEFAQKLGSQLNMKVPVTEMEVYDSDFGEYISIDELSLVGSKAKIRVHAANEQDKPKLGRRAQHRSGSRSISSMILKLPELCKAGIIDDKGRAPSLGANSSLEPLVKLVGPI